MKQNVLEEITDPLDEEWRTLPVTNPCFFARFFMHTGILGVPGVRISFLGVLRGVTMNASLVTLPVSLFGHKIKLLLFTEYIVHMS